MADAVLVLSAVLGLSFLSTRAADWLRVPHSVLLVVLGLAGGWLYNRAHEPLSAEVAHLFPEVVLYLLLPPLIFESAYHLSYEDLRRDLLPVTTLAVGGLLLSTAAIALGLSGLGVPWQAAWLFGALISATDPVAVVSLVRNLGAPRRLAILLEGESLCNDGTAIVLFRVLLAGAAGLGQAAGQFVLVVVGGVLVGLAFSWAFRLLFWFTARSGLAQAGLTVVAAYSSFIVADHTLHVSGVICTMVVGLTLGKQARLQLNRETLGAMQGIWELLALTANSLVFLAVGLTAEVDKLPALGALVPLTLLLVIGARLAAVFGSLGLLNRLGWSRPISLAYQLLLTWGGLRGGLALALALTLPVHLPYRGQLLLLATAVVLCSLLFNAMTTGPLIRWLGLNQLTDREELFYRRGLRQGVLQVFADLGRGVTSGALSEQLLESLQERCLKELEGEDEGSGTAFDLYQLLLAEQQAYNAHLEEGRLSPQAYTTLRHAVESRLSILQLQGPEALQSYDFRLELPPVPRWTVARARQELQRLADELEVLLHLDLVTSQLEALPHLQPAARQTLAVWSAAASQRLADLQLAYPDLSLAVQSLFVARAIGTSARAALDELHEAEIIGPAVQARAARTVAELVGELTEESWRRLREPDLSLGRVELFAELPAEALDTLQRSARFQRLEAGQTIYGEGDPAESLFVVISGILEVRSTRFVSAEQHPRLFPGSFFGELSLLARSPRTATVTALGRCDVLELPQEVLERVMEAHPGVRARLEQEAARRRQRDAELSRTDLS